MTEKRLIAFMAIFFFIPTGIGFAGASEPPVVGSDCVPHPPIVIRGDVPGLGFVIGEDPITGDPVYRPGSGVIGGTGIPEDPYVIAGWCIVNAHLGAISITASDAHLLIVDNEIGGLYYGIHIGLAENIKLVNNTIVNGRDGVWAISSKSLYLGGNIFTDVETAIYFQGVTESLVDGNTISGGPRGGIRMSQSPDNRIEQNHVSHHSWGLLIGTRSHNTTVVDNTFRDNLNHGLSSSESRNIVVANNTVTGHSRAGIWFLTSSGFHVHNNNITDNGNGIELDGAQYTWIHNNTITENSKGLVVGEDARFVDARWNWWGCPQGPSHADCDDVTGNVTVDPWRTSPEMGAFLAEPDPPEVTTPGVGLLGLLLAIGVFTGIRSSRRWKGSRQVSS